MSKYKSQTERIDIVLNIVRQMKNYPKPGAYPKSDETIDLYKDDYEYVSKFKTIFTKYIKQDDTKPDSLQEFRGVVFLSGSLERDVEYILPIHKHREPLFVIRMKNRRT